MVTEVGVAPLRATDADDGNVEPPVALQLVERRQQLAPGQIPAGAEQDQDVAAVRGGDRRGHRLSSPDAAGFSR